MSSVKQIFDVIKSEKGLPTSVKGIQKRSFMTRQIENHQSNHIEEYGRKRKPPGMKTEPFYISP